MSDLAASGRPVLAYVRPLPPGSMPLEVAIQRRAVAACAQGEGLAVPRWFVEASPDSRAAFAALVERIEVAEGATVLLATLAVLSETVVEQAWRLLALEFAGARVIFADGRTPAVALAEAWAKRPDPERRRERARDGMRRRALRAEVLGRPPYGYAVEGRSLEPLPREARVVERMFALYLDEGEGIRRIAAQLNRDGIKTRRGAPWSTSSVRTVLRNPVYTGLYRRLGIAVPKAHVALVPAARFQEAQRRLDARRTSSRIQERRPYLLAGLVRCGHCGNRMIGARRPGGAGEVVLYRCESAENQGRCRYRSRRADELEALVRGELIRATDPYPVAARTEVPPEDDLEARRDRAERRVARMLERWESGEWAWPELVRRVGASASSLLEAERADLSVPGPDAAEARGRLVAEWESLDFATRRDLLRAAVAEITVTEDAVRVTRRRA
ncbi:MAG: recombinase family protein [Chloroflexi bacterium]|nr:recombinase family protein [Chloroflexota bacterium]MQC25389.1 hypothetical protein [Chloroflexota bacterium]